MFHYFKGTPFSFQECVGLTSTKSFLVMQSRVIRNDYPVLILSYFCRSLRHMMRKELLSLETEIRRYVIEILSNAVID